MTNRSPVAVRSEDAAHNVTERLRVLVVDDNEDAAVMLAEVLSVMGYVTSVAHDGRHALAEAERFKPDVALVDIGLPIMDGYELARRLRACPSLDSVRLIAVTGYGLDSDRARAFDAGFDHHMVKPIDIASLRALLSIR